jgi:Tol biopolymer transport system component
MALTPGTRLGPYEILSAFGAGGMGEVYRARDTRLKRDVALKVLPESLAADTERLARFQREAEVLASLNHPNIAHIHGLEDSGHVHALIMELVAGEDLSERIARGPIPLDETLPIAKQIAEALEAAHEQGIVHRDLKPANIKVTPDGVVKVLDFGLAKLNDPNVSNPNGPNALSMSTITSPAMMTGVGAILGTAAYMSPEQAKGRQADKRSDVWAFGAVVYELLTGTRAFDGESVVETLGAVINREPDWAPVPQPARRLLRWCLEKDRKKRLQAIGDAKRLLEEAEQSQGRSDDPSRSAMGRSYVAWAVAALFLVITLGVSFLYFGEDAPAESGLVRFQIPAPGNAPAEMFRLSPNGRSLAFVVSDNGLNRVWVRSLDSVDAKALPGTDGATYPFWSRDNEHLGFFAQGKLKKIAVAGGPPQTLCDAATGRGGTWNREGEIVFSPGPVGILYRVSAAGGVPAPATKVAVSGSNEGHRFPEFLPDGRHFFYVIGSPEVEAAGLYLGSLDGSEPVRILPDESNAAYAPPSMSGGDGLLLFRREDTLMAQPFDPDHMRTNGDMFPVAEQVGTTGNIGSGAFSVAAAGVLVFRATGGASRELVWMDRTGKRGAAVTKPFRDDQVASGFEVALSPDEKRVAFASVDRNQQDLWLLDLAQGGTSRFTFIAGNARAIWSPDASRLVFSRRSGSTYELYQKPSRGGDEQVLPLVHGVTNAQPWDWSTDGKLVVYSVTGEKTANDLWLLPMEGSHEPIPYLQTPASEQYGQFSPDGRWMAYVSNESGQNQIYVQPVPAGGAKWQISTTGGSAPKWRRDGKELFYVAPDQKLMAVPVKIGADFEAGTPQPLPVSAPVPIGNGSTGGYAPTRDGQRFLVNVPAGGEAAVAPPITVVLNWQGVCRSDRGAVSDGSTVLSHRRVIALGPFYKSVVCRGDCHGYGTAYGRRRRGHRSQWKARAGRW